MINPAMMQTELDVLEEKIATLEHLIKGKKGGKTDMDNYLGRKLSEYQEQYGKLKQNLTDLGPVNEEPEEEANMA